MGVVPLFRPLGMWFTLALEIGEYIDCIICSLYIYFQECTTALPGMAAMLGGPELPSKGKVYS